MESCRVKQEMGEEIVSQDRSMVRMRWSTAPGGEQAGQPSGSSLQEGRLLEEANGPEVVTGSKATNLFFVGVRQHPLGILRKVKSTRESQFRRGGPR